MAIVEENFPRGGKAVTDKKQTPHYEKKRKSDSLFKVNVTAKKKRKNQNIQKKKGDEDSSDEEVTTKKDLKKAVKEKTTNESIDPLSYKMLSEGMHLLSKIQEVREMDVLISLPGRIQAVVPITNISTPYSNLLHKLAYDEEVEIKGLKDILTVGQLLPCTIKEVTTDNSYKVTASFNPADLCSDIPFTALAKGMMLTAAVESVEDHGYVMDIGMANVRSFLPKESESVLAVGQVVRVCVTSCKIDGSVATLSLSTNFSVKFKQNVEIRVCSLVPGTRLHIHIKKVTPQGLMVTFGNLTGYIHKDHLAQTFDDLKSYSQSSAHVAVVLYTVPLVNTVFLSLKPALIDPSKNSPATGLALGRIFDSAPVLESTSAGIFVQLNKEAKGFVPLRHLSDNQDFVEDIKSLYPKKSRKRCRILQYAALDDIYVCTMKKSMLEQKALRYEDFTVGELVQAKIENCTTAGVSVHLGVNLKGFIPKLHWADDPRLKKPELRFRPGESITCKVLKLWPEKKTLHLTCKKSLVEDNGPIYDHVGQLNKNTRLKGTIALIEKGGVLVSFYGELTGWIPSVKLFKEGITDITRVFYVGQLVDCVVEDIAETGKVRLSLGKGVSEKPDSSASSKPVHCAGTIVKCQVEKICTDEKESKGLEVSVDTLNIKAFIPAEHLSDFPRLGMMLLKCFNVGDTIDEAVVWSSSKMQTILTLKRSILDFARQDRYPHSFDDVKSNSILPLVSYKHREFGVFAAYLLPPEMRTALFPKSKLTEPLYEALGKDDAHYASLQGKIINIDKEQKKIGVSALDHDLPKTGDQLLSAYFEDIDRIKTTMANSQDEKLKYLAGLKFGDTVVGKLVKDFDPSSSLQVELPHNVEGIVPVEHHGKAVFKQNDRIVGRVLYCDVVRQLVYVTIRPDIMASMSTAKTNLPKENKIDGEVFLNQDYFSLVYVRHGKKSKGSVYVSNIQNINQATEVPPPPYKVGDHASVVVKAIEHGNIATYWKLPSRSAAKSKNSTKRQLSVEDGPPKKKSKKGEKAAVKPSVKQGGPEDTASKVHEKKKKPQKATPECAGKVAEESVADPAASDRKSKEKGQKKKGKKAVAEESSDPPSGNAPTEKAPARRPVLEVTDEVEETSPRKKMRVETARKTSLDLPRLSVSVPFKWEEDTIMLPQSSNNDSSDSEEEGAEPEKAVVTDRRERARQKLEQARIDEAKLSQIEESLNDPNRTPVSADDFDRMVVASPNSSIVWLQYMAFHLENAEIEKARSVAQRALKTISFREEQEKFNVWIALLNLEHVYGTTEGYEETFQEALRYNDPFKVYRQMALNLEQSGKFDEAESLHNTMMKKFKQDKSVWFNACLFYVRNSKLDTARSVFQRALLVIDKKEHVDLISRFAQLEVKFGQLERGKTLFDTLMMSYPKRTDLWLVYVDTLTKAGDIESARQVLERCITLQLPAKKMKTIFSKFIEFEKTHGGDDRQEYVRRKALEYVESKNEDKDD